MNSLVAIALSSAVAGSLDFAAASISAKTRGIAFMKLWQFVASGALGAASFQGGPRTAMIGMCFHYLIATFWAMSFYLLSRVQPVILTHPFICGAAYGIMIHVVMSWVVLPLSRTAKRQLAWRPWLIELTIHITFIGIPIASVQSWSLRG